MSVDSSGADAGAASAGGEIVLIRHAETEWSLDGRHTGRTDIPLTEAGRALAGGLPERLARWPFATVLCSPSKRARETCELAGLGALAQTCEALYEWDYGDYEGLTTSEIREHRPGWDVWEDGCPGGESLAAVGARADRAIAEASVAPGPVAIFSHGHLLRVLGARWIALGPEQGARLGLSTAALCILGHERAKSVLVRWNDSVTGRI